MPRAKTAWRFNKNETNENVYYTFCTHVFGLVKYVVVARLRLSSLHLGIDDDDDDGDGCVYMWMCAAVRRAYPIQMCLGMVNVSRRSTCEIKTGTCDAYVGAQEYSVRVNPRECICMNI